MVDKQEWGALLGQLQALSDVIARKWNKLSAQDVKEANGNPEVLAAKIATRYGVSKEEALKQLKALASSKSAATPKQFGSAASKPTDEPAKTTLMGSSGKATSPSKQFGSAPGKPTTEPAKATLKGSSGKPTSTPQQFGSTPGKSSGKVTSGGAAEDDEIEVLASKLQAKFGISKEQARQQIEGLKAAKVTGKLKPATTTPPQASPASPDAGPAGLNIESLAGSLGALFGMGGAATGSGQPQQASDDPISGLLGMLGGQDLGISGGNLEGIAGQLMDQLGIEPEDALEQVLEWVKNLK